MKEFKTEEEMECVFDEGAESILEYADMDTARVVEPDVSDRRINLNMPEWLVKAIDVEAARAGANRQSYINMTMCRAIDEARKERIA